MSVVRAASGGLEVIVATQPATDCATSVRMTGLWPPRGTGPSSRPPPAMAPIGNSPPTPSSPHPAAPPDGEQDDLAYTKSEAAES